MNRLQNWLVERLKLKVETQYVVREESETALRARPGQELEASHWMYAPNPEAARWMPYYALNVWVYTAVARLAESAALAGLEVVDPADTTRQYPDHGLLRLLGRYKGRPNDVQDAYEFFENHFTFLDLAGNAYWYWFGAGGAPTEVFHLDPRQVQIIPGRSQTVAGYVYRTEGRDIALPAESVTHFRKANPFSWYYGQSALESLALEVSSDRSMAEWNRDFFSADVSLPAGILVVPTSVSEADRNRMAEDLAARHGGGRRSTAVVRAEAGATSWLSAGLSPKDMDFEQGRLLSRKAVYECLGLPLGLMSESSTEAHARVAERRLVDALEVRHTRTAGRINADAMLFWATPATWGKRIARFEDLRARVADWEQEKKKLEAVAPYLTVNEVRTKYLNMQPREDGDRYGNEGKNARPDGSAGSGERTPAASERDAAPGSEERAGGARPEAE